MKHAQMVFRVKSRLEYYAESMGLHIQVKVTGYSPAETKLESDGKTYRYPETLEVKIENWHNHFYSFRTKDGRWIPEGRNLTGKGISTFRVIRSMMRELKEWHEVKFPKPTNVIPMRRAK